MSPRSHVANVAIKEALTLAEDIAGELAEELGQEVGKEEVPRRTIRGLIRKAIEGDTKAMLKVISIAMDSGHGVVPEPCSVCAETDNILRGEGI